MEKQKRKIIIITGMSGAGKSTVVNALEDFGYFVVDNLPCEIIPLFAKSKRPKIAIGLDSRTFDDAKELIDILELLKKDGLEYALIFLDASDEVILNRYNLTRRRHPVVATTLLESIQKERVFIDSLKKESDAIIDTTFTTSKELMDKIKNILNIDKTHNELNVHIISFGFKFGVPLDVDLVFDVRFLPNPYYIKELKNKTGLDIEVVNYLEKFNITKEFRKKLEDLINFLIPNYIKEGKKHLTIAFGCSGGKHRSVAFASYMYQQLSKMENLNVYILHREKERKNW